jgi:hypothetical protein
VGGWNFVNCSQGGIFQRSRHWLQEESRNFASLLKYSARKGHKHRNLSDKMRLNSEQDDTKAGGFENRLFH